MLFIVEEAKCSSSSPPPRSCSRPSCSFSNGAITAKEPPFPPARWSPPTNLEQPCPVLFSTRYGLKGKPDAILRTPNGLAPIERKHSRAPRRPHDSDVIQAAAYCLLIEDNYGETPLFMRIHYADTWFDVPFTDKHRQWVLQVSERLRAARTKDNCGRSHSMPAKCRSCAQRPNCNQAL